MSAGAAGSGRSPRPQQRPQQRPRAPPRAPLPPEPNLNCVSGLAQSTNAAAPARPAPCPPDSQRPRRFLAVAANQGAACCGLREEALGARARPLWSRWLARSRRVLRSPRPALCWCLSRESGGGCGRRRCPSSWRIRRC